MQVKSGIGNFHIEFDRVTLDEEHVVLLGTVDDWDSRTLMTPGEFVRLAVLSLRPRILFFLLKRGIPQVLRERRKS
jgi:hypothetical protein